MRIASLAIDPLTTLPIVVLEDEAGLVTVPIRVGASDASAIAAELEQIDFLWPTTHRLMGDLLASAGVRVRSVELDAVDDGSFFGVIHLELPSGERVRQEARPSDALALALRAGAELRVAPAVVEGAAREAVPAAAALPLPAASAAGGIDAGPADEAAELVESYGDLLSEWPTNKWKM